MQRKRVLIMVAFILLLLAGVMAVFFARPLKSAVKKLAAEATLANIRVTLTAVAQTRQVQGSGSQAQTPSATDLPQKLAVSTPVPAAGETKISAVDGMVMVYIPAGSFLMGTLPEAEDKPEEELPQHQVFLDGYWIDQTPVTIRQFHLCIESKKCGKVAFTSKIYPEFEDPAFAEHPVTYIDWYAAKRYCTWAGGRLPSEAEWEKAARGTDGRLYPWGNQAPDPTRLNFNKVFGGTTVVGSFPAGASPYGVLDMAGNVRQWIADWYGDSYYKNSPLANPLGPESGEKKLLRGGGWDDSQLYVRSASRLTHVPKSPGQNRGFRCVR